MPKRKYMLFSNPRTCSYLFLRILNLQDREGVKHASNHFIGTGMKIMADGLFEKDPEVWTEVEKREVCEYYEGCIKELLKDEGGGGEGEEEEVLVVREHADTVIEPMRLIRYAMGTTGLEKEARAWGNLFPRFEAEQSEKNPTIFPDTYLVTWTPIFLIRHPARAFESLYRALVDVGKAVNASQAGLQGLMEAHMTLKWMRGIYEFYSSQGDTPILIDADDVLLNTQQIMSKVADLLGLDKGLLRFEWSKATEEDVQAKGQVLGRMLDTLDKSTGVEVDEVKLGRSFEGAENVWSGEFGDVVAEKLKGWVEGALEDYVWLRERRIRL